MTHPSLLAAVAVATMAFAGAAPAATYSFATQVGTTSVSGFFEIDDASANYVGGGTTNEFDLLDYAFTFVSGVSEFIGTVANASFLQTFNVTFSSDLATATSIDFSLGFDDGTIGIALTGNNLSGDGYVQVAHFGSDLFDGFEQPAPAIGIALIEAPAAVPLPASLPLLAVALAGLGLASRRRRG